MKLIPLTQGKFAKVDDKWYDLLVAMGPWCYYEKCEGAGHGYARAYLGGGRNNSVLVDMQNIVLRAPNGLIVDHINLDSLDNQEHNLRAANVSQQMVNRGARSDNTSGVPGVSWDKTAKTWRVYTDKDGKRICLGLRKNLIDAVALRNQGAAKVHGEFARTFDLTNRVGVSLAPTQRKE